jgi:recombination protein RecA
MVALDLAGIPEKFVRRIPLASWFRFQRAVEHTKTALLVVSEFACAQTCAAMVLKLGNQLSAISAQPSGKPSHTELLEKMRIDAELVRMRLERKPAGSVRTVFATRAIRAG